MFPALQKDGRLLTQLLDETCRLSIAVSVDEVSACPACYEVRVYVLLQFLDVMYVDSTTSTEGLLDTRLISDLAACPKLEVGASSSSTRSFPPPS
eukprot:scaffold123840_cov18-Tisochrysis_lutea.AAC.4